ncbi:hypothetical protein SCHPADRAFT_927936 [Schizopora paradoxa]|uniref:Uncharacterized protein n=1 Tax=Schizopora paradoxa TaxID=27342 RepID=A0A0H2RRU7_9AGAM|nr:hypothetical protein SCHPADRAFT_927936 [Schizopora paradoxa]
MLPISSHNASFTSPEDRSLQTYESITTISTDATAPNLPGAGRTVGLALDSLGARLEVYINRQATVYLDVGPEVVAGEIRRLRYTQEASPTAQLSRAEARRLKRLCERLVRYARRSRTTSVRERALNEVETFAAGDPALYNILEAQIYARKLRRTDEVTQKTFSQLISSFDKSSFKTRSSDTSTIWSGRWIRRHFATTSEETTATESREASASVIDVKGILSGSTSSKASGRKFAFKAKMFW